MAALKVASVEGGTHYGAVGDQGTSFGPWQLHIGGAMPAQYATPSAAAAFANSPEGVHFALSQMAKVAGGLSGKAAVAAIVRGFERPADPSGEIQRALGTTVGAVPGAMSAPAVPSLSEYSQAKAPSFALSNGLQESLSTMMNPQGDPALSSLSETLSRQAKVNAGQQRALAAALKPAESPAAPSFAPTGPAGRVTLAPGADRAGVRTNPAVLSFVGQVAGMYGRPLTIGTGTNHSRYTVNGSESDHWGGNAADVPASGDALIRMGQDALIAAGMPEAQARKQTGGGYNIGPYQVIFNTDAPGWGNHFDHLHVGLRG